MHPFHLTHLSRIVANIDSVDEAARATTALVSSFEPPTSAFITIPTSNSTMSRDVQQAAQSTLRQTDEQTSQPEVNTT